MNSKDFLLNALLHFRCLILPIYCHVLRALPFQVLWISVLRKSSGISLIKQNWQKFFSFFLYFALKECTVKSRTQRLISAICRNIRSLQLVASWDEKIISQRQEEIFCEHI